MLYRVSWTGVVEKTIPIETPADALYHVWSRYRDDFAGGDIHVDVDEGGRGVRLAQLSFPVTVRREIEAATPADAVRTFLYDDRVPHVVRVRDIEVVSAHETDDHEPMPSAARVEPELVRPRAPQLMAAE